jgi:hypothetical protein
VEEPAAVNPGWRKSSYSSNGGANCVEIGAIPWRKSSYGSNGGVNCVEAGAIPWRKSSYSSNGGVDCVEAGHAHGTVLIRDTTQRGTGPVLRVSAETWRAFTAAVRTSAAVR